MKRIWNEMGLINNVLIIILLIIFVSFTYVAIEPFIYVTFGYGWYWDYNPDFIPLIDRE